MLSRFSTANLVRLARWVHSSTAKGRRPIQGLGDEDLKEEEEDEEGDVDLTFPIDIHDEKDIPHGNSTSELAQNASGKKISVCLPTVYLPKALEEAIEKVLTCHNRKEHVKDGIDLSRYLYNRIPVGCEWKRDTKKLEIDGMRFLSFCNHSLAEPDPLHGLVKLLGRGITFP